MSRARVSPYDRMMKKVRVCEITGCWLFEGALDQNGHGNVYISKGVVDKAHRISYRHHKGEIPKGKVVRHECDTRNCVNPKDLILGSQLDNVWDMIYRNRHHDHREPNGRFAPKEEDEIPF